jgi:alanyl-tRNA synthetase
MKKKAATTRKSSSGKKPAAAGSPAPPIADAGEAAWTVARLRREWIDYFQSQGHTQTASAGLIPAGDPTLLFTTAGMVQFKAYFAGTEQPPHPRTATIQKCLRTTDLESVGKTDRHLTFFEMLGNFSFGDYFKREAIRFAWEFSLERLKLDPEKIWVTVYEEDDEAEEIWHTEIGVPKERIRRLGKADNWWGPAGETGACGPCSELYLDRGPEHGGPNETGPGDEGDRFMEYWNLVFNQFHQDAAGQLHPLPQTGIDTGAGLERIVALLNNRDSVFDTDELARIIAAIVQLTAELREDGRRIDYTPETKTPFRVITDHLRAVSFAISDGIFPGNTGRGYVIRRILRRALLYARELGIVQPVLYRLVPLVGEIYGPFYPALREKNADIQNRIHLEEERFLRTLEQGLARLEDYMTAHRQAGAKIFSGDDAFTLYDTFGFPPEITIELAEKQGLPVDTDRFQARMTGQQQRAASAGQWKTIALPPDMPAGTTEFVGYDATRPDDSAANRVAAKVVALLASENPGEADERSVTRLEEGARGIVVLDRSPFYAEGGGQLGDHGQISAAGGAVFAVEDTRKNGGFHLHLGELKNGTLKVGDTVSASIDVERRLALTRHHSATHLLNEALRQTLGDHIVQTGSLVAPDYLRFDFSHPQKIDDATLEQIESQVNAAIEQRAAVQAEVLPIEEARKKGAVATFGEKYGSEVRVVSMGQGGALSLEFCGGCHVNNTGDVGLFHITRETSPGAGNRRIEAVTGDHALRYFQEALDETQARIAAHNDRVQAMSENAAYRDAASAIKALYIPSGLPEAAGPALRQPADGLELHRRIETARERVQTAEKQLIKLEKGLLNQKGGELIDTVDEALAGAEEIGGVKVVRLALENQDPGMLRKFGDKLKEKSRGIVVLLGNKNEKGPSLLFMADRQAVQAGADAGALIRVAAAVLGGGGGGRPEMAQAGGKDASKLEAALKAARDELARATGPSN